MIKMVSWKANMEVNISHGKGKNGWPEVYLERYVRLDVR
jgi:hypothetical protein